MGIGDLDLSEEAYMETIHHKTASLLSACIGDHVRAGGLPESARRLGQQTGLHLGHAFQIVDDLADYCSDAAHLGKDILAISPTRPSRCRWSIFSGCRRRAARCSTCRVGR
ncbi:polyprenyl synthetase family protein [bacterium]|nr:polyprenyl synthetase family protein [bacterium]